MIEAIIFWVGMVISIIYLLWLTNVITYTKVKRDKECCSGTKPQGIPQPEKAPSAKTEPTAHENNREHMLKGGKNMEYASTIVMHFPGKGGKIPTERPL